MSSTAAVSNFRVFDLPWTPSVEEERRFRRLFGAALGLFIGFGDRDPAAARPAADRGHGSGRAGADRRVHPRAAQAETGAE